MKPPRFFMLRETLATLVAVLLVALIINAQIALARNPGKVRACYIAADEIDWKMYRAASTA